MDENRRDELLSAYLDGELEAAETARIEQLLGEDEQARLTLEEMQAVRRALRALPRRDLDADFAGGVIRRAERAVLSGAATASPQNDRPTEAASHVKRHWRRIVWPLVAVAAALLIAVNPGGFFSPSRQNEPLLVLQDEDESNEATPAANSSEVAVLPTGDSVEEKLNLEAPSEKGAGEAAAAADKQVAADPFGKDAAAIAADGTKAALATPGDLDDTIYVICDVSPNMSPREVARQMEGRYRGAAKGNKFQQAVGAGYANAEYFKLSKGGVSPQRRGAVAATSDAELEALVRKNESPSDAPANAVRTAADDAGAGPLKKRQAEPQGEVTLVTTMTEDQLQVVVGQLRAQRGWTVAVGKGAVVEADEALAEESPKRALGRSDGLNRRALEKQQDAASAFGVRQRPAPQLKAEVGKKPLGEPAAPPPAAAAPKADKAADVANAPKKSRDKLDRARAQRFKSADLDKLEFKQPAAKDKKSAGLALTGDRPPLKQREGGKSKVRTVDGKLAEAETKALGGAVADFAQKSPPRRVVFIFRAAAVPQVEAAEQAK